MDLQTTENLHLEDDLNLSLLNPTLPVLIRSISRGQHHLLKSLLHQLPEALGSSPSVFQLGFYF